MVNAAKILYRLLLAIVLWPQLSWQISQPSDSTYHAAVVEFVPGQGTPKEKMRANLAQMKDIIQSNNTKDLDILVFPEYVLNPSWPTYVPDPKLKIAPCVIPDYDNFLNELSCAVRSRHLYVVVNLMEKEFCGNTNTSTPCNDNGINIYNTNVVFDREGRVISRYRKTHLYRYEWYSTNVMAEPQLATFSTDFNVTFGHFICFDMLFWSPAQQLVKEMGITDIIYPTFWFSELPFMTAVQVQEGWAYANEVNLLAADASNPNGQTTGSGIYAGRHGRLTAVIKQEPETSLLKVRVPKPAYRDIELPPVIQPKFEPKLEMNRFTKMSLLRDYNVDVFNTSLLPADFTNHSAVLCYGKDFCCKFEVQRKLIENSNMHSAYRYRLVAYNGDGVTHQRIEPCAFAVCAIIACTNEELYSCGHIFPESVKVGNKHYFSALNVSARFPHAPRRLIMPSSVDGMMMPVPVPMYAMKQSERSNGTDVYMALTSPKSDLLTFGIWANYYTDRVSKHNRDPIKIPPLESQKNTGHTLTITSTFLLISITTIGSFW